MRQSQPSIPQLVAEFTSRRGITERNCCELALLANVKPGRDVVAQLEHAEQSVKNSQQNPDSRIPPGFYIARLIESNTPVPDGFETRAQRKAREEREQKERAAACTGAEGNRAATSNGTTTRDYCATETDRYID